MPPSSLHQQALQRLSLLRVASIGTWIAFVFYFVFQHAIILSYTSLMIAPYVGLFSVGAWQAWRSQVYSKHLTIHLVLECQLLTCRSEEHTSELQSRPHLVCRLLLEKKKKNNNQDYT